MQFIYRHTLTNTDDTDTCEKVKMDSVIGGAAIGGAVIGGAVAGAAIVAVIFLSVIVYKKRYDAYYTVHTCRYSIKESAFQIIKH